MLFLQNHCADFRFKRIPGFPKLKTQINILERKGRRRKTKERERGEYLRPYLVNYFLISRQGEEKASSKGKREKGARKDENIVKREKEEKEGRG